MSKKPSPRLLTDIRTELEQQQLDLTDRRKRLQTAIDKPIPAFDSEASQRRIATIELRDALTGTANAAAVIKEESEARAAFDTAERQRLDAIAAIDSLASAETVIRDELERVTFAINEHVQSEAHQKFVIERDRLFKLATEIRQQAILVYAIHRAAGLDFGTPDITLPRFGAQTELDGFITIPAGYLASSGWLTLDAEPITQHTIHTLEQAA